MERGVQYLLEASIKLECDVELTSRALLLYHHFMGCIDEVEYEPSIIVASCLLVSSRIIGQTLDINTVLVVFFGIVKGNVLISSNDIDVVKKSLIRVDYLLQRMLEFNLNHRLAHQYLVPFLSVIFERSSHVSRLHKPVSMSCIRLLTDFYTSRNCLNYLPEHIAVAGINVALELHGMSGDLMMVQPWYQGFCNGLNFDKLKKIEDDMLHVYTQKPTDEDVVVLCE